MTRGRAHDWDAETRLGTMPDKDLAALIGCHYSYVCTRRVERGIAPFSPDGPIVDWDAQPLGQDADVLIAWRAGSRVAVVRAHRHRRALAAPSDAIQLRGWRVVLQACDDDREVATRLGVAITTVAAWRLRVARTPDSDSHA